MRAAFPSARLSNLYGLSETSGASVISHPDDSPDLVDTTIGTSIGDVQARIVDDSGDLVPPGAEGELQLRGTCVADGYWDMPAETRSTFLPDGWLATGDMGTMTRDGHITIRGRKKEMYVRGGYNVYPAEVENVLFGIAVGAWGGSAGDHLGQELVHVHAASPIPDLWP